MDELGLTISKSEKKEKTEKEPKNNITNSELTRTGISKENEYFKNIIIDLEKEIEKEKNISKDISEENRNVLYEIKKKILDYEKEIKYYSIKNEKQREELQLFSKEVSNKINRINVNDISKKLKNSKDENNLIKDTINQKNLQIENILSMVKSNTKENKSLKNKLLKFKTEDKSDILKQRENEILELKRKIKIKKVQLEEHSKCSQIKINLIKKLEELKNEINIYKDVYENSKNELKNLEDKKKSTILLDSINTIRVKKKNRVLNIKLLNVTNNSINNMNNLIYEIKKNKIFSQKKMDLQKDEEERIDIPSKISETFNEKELKAIFIGLDKDKLKFKNIIKEFNIKKERIITLELKHKFDIKEKLNKINDIDKQIEYLNMKKEENMADIELCQKLINKFSEEKKLYLNQNNKLNKEIKEKKKLNERKEQEINSLGKQLIQLKKIIKNRDYKFMKEISEIEIGYTDNI